ncbi:MAG: acyl-[acyl-carrier-protein] desaturase [Acidimicrobiales bacterium]|jgi:acyl-[acyl-carrier-protein] desaturase
MVLDSDVAFLAELEPVAEKLLDRHFEKTKEWHPHTLVPWSRGEDFADDYEWSPEEANLPEEVRSALFVNILTEDNLPYYFRDIERMFGRDGAWGTWVRRWTAEEGRHAVAIRDYLTITRAIDPVVLERARMVQMGGGQVPEPPNAAAGMCYVALQELATRISHRNTGALIEDRAGYDIMRQVAIDENHHFLFYRDIAQAGFEANPSQMVIALENEVVNFAMPGTGIPDFEAHSKRIAKAGIYDMVAHYEQILEPVVMRYWGVPQLTGLSPEAEAAQERIVAYVERIGRVVARTTARRGSRPPESSTEEDSELVAD